MERILFKIGLVWCGLVLMVFLGSSLFYYSYYSTKKSVKVVTMPVVETKAAAMTNETVENKIESQEVEADARPLLIKRYLEKYNSPLVPYYQMIFDLSETYGFEYYWIPAIAQQESNLCKKIPEDSHNCWGYGIHKNGTLKFDSYELALKSYAEYLKRVYFDKGLNTPELIMKKYCPHSDGSWARGVNQFINTIESGNF